MSPHLHWTRAARPALRYGAPLLAACLTVALFSPIFEVGFVSDDFPHILLARQVNWADIWQPIPGVLHYSPLSVAWRKLVDILVDSPSGWHLLSLGLLAVAATLAGRVARALGARPLEAACVSIVFPTLACSYEPTVWATVNVYLLALDLYLGALVSYAAFQRSGWNGGYLAALALGALATLTLESAVVFLPSLVLLEYARGGRRAALSAWPRYLAPALVTLAIVVWAVPSHPLNGSPWMLVGKRALVALSYLASFNQPALLRIYFEHVEVRWLVSLLLVGAAVVALAGGPRRLRGPLLFALSSYAPYLAMTAHHPRYFLFGAAGMVACWMAALAALARMAARRAAASRGTVGVGRLVASLALVGLVVAGGAVHTRERIGTWRAASAGVQSARMALAAELRSTTTALVLVDFPEMQGPYHDVDWPAYMFLSAFNDMALLRLTGAGIVPPRVELLSTGQSPERPRVGSGVAESELARMARRCGQVVLRFIVRTNSVARVKPESAAAEICE